jgi:hypothetical protein
MTERMKPPARREGEVGGLGAGEGRVLSLFRVQRHHRQFSTLEAHGSSFL